MYILCNNFLDEYRIFQIAVFELHTGYYLFEIFSIDWVYNIALLTLFL